MLRDSTGSLRLCARLRADPSSRYNSAAQFPRRRPRTWRTFFHWQIDMEGETPFDVRDETIQRYSRKRNRVG
jgi:hypothetical protein